MADRYDQRTSAYLWNLLERCQRVCPRGVFRRHLLHDRRMLRGYVAFFLWIRSKVKQLPRVFFIFLVQPPVLPADGDQVTSNGVTRSLLSQNRYSCAAPLRLPLRNGNRSTPSQCVGIGPPANAAIVE